MNTESPMTSLEAARRLGRPHAVVLKRIRALERDTPEHAQRNYKPWSYTSRGRHLPMYRVTTDGWRMLIMSVRSPNSMQLCSAMFDEFDALKASLRARRDVLAEHVMRSEDADPAALADLERTIGVLRQADAVFGGIFVAPLADVITLPAAPHAGPAGDDL